MSRLISLLCALALALACTCIARDGAARPTSAQREAARTHANNGRDLFKNGKFDLAIEEFRAAEEIIHAPPHLLYIARAQSHVGRLLEARDTYGKIIEEKLSPRAPKAFHKAQQSARAELDAINEKIPHISIAVKGPPLEDVTVSIDGVPVDATALSEELPLDPGDHQVLAEAAGYDSDRNSFELQPGEGTVAIELTLVESADETTVPVEPTDEESTLTVPPFILLGGGVALLAVGGITGGLALGKASDLKDLCPQNPCPTENESLADDANMLATVSTITFVVGGVATAAGAAWLIWDLTAGGDEAGEDDEDTDTAWTLRPYAGPDRIGVVGTF